MKKEQPVQQAELLPGVEPAKKSAKSPKPKPSPAKKTAASDTRAIVQRGDDPGKAIAIAEPQPSNFLTVVMRAASDPNCDPAKMHALLDFQERLESRESERAFDEAFGRLQAELPVIRADRKIEIRAKASNGERTGAIQQSTPYATFPAIMKAIQPLLTKNGLRLSFSTSPMEPIVVGESFIERILVTGILSGYGAKRTTQFAVRPDNSGSKNPTQAQGSGQSYGKRYCTVALLNIISEAKEDADLDGNPPPKAAGARSDDSFPGDRISSGPAKTITEEQSVKLRDLIEWCGVAAHKVLEHYGIKKLTELPADKFAAAEQQCKDYHANREAKAKHG